MNKKIVIETKDPFITDMFDRSKQIINLYNLVITSEKQFVSCINSEYGLGKTTFFKMFEAYVKNENDKKPKNPRVISVYYDAWENDYIGNPLISLISCLTGAIESKNDVTEQDISKLLGLIGSKITEKMTGGIVTPKKFYEELNDTPIRNVIEEYLTHKSSLDDIKSGFLRLSRDLNNFKAKKVIFFIDELDRCKPTFALALLEIIKHFFDLPNFFFILAVDKKQLYSTIKMKYGESINSEGYLKRFIDFDITLSPISIKKYVDEYSLKYRQINSISESVFSVFKLVSENMDLTLRDYDKMFYYLELLSPLKWWSHGNTPFEEIDYLEHMTLGVFIALKVIDEELYHKFMSKTLNTDDKVKLSNILRFQHHDNVDTFGINENYLTELYSTVSKVYSLYVLDSKSNSNKKEKIWGGPNAQITFSAVMNASTIQLESIDKAQLLYDVIH